MTDETPPLRISADARMEMRRIGREGHPLLIIDNAISEPERLVEAADSRRV